MAASFAPAAVGLTMFVALAQLRMDDPWAVGTLFVVALVAAVPVLGLGLAADREANSPRGATTVLLVAGLGLAAIALVRFGQVLAGDDWTNHGGTLTLVLALFVILAGACYRRTGSAACLLLASLVGVGLLVEAVHWIFDTDNADVLRALLVFAFATLLVSGLTVTGRSGTILVGAAGVTSLATAFTFSAFLFLVPIGGQVGWGWELVLLAEGLALLAYAAVELEPGPGYLALFTLVLFVGTAANVVSGELETENSPDQLSHSLVGWPLAIAIATALAAGWAVLGARRAE